MNFYAVVAIINAITSLILGSFVFFKNKKNPINIGFALFALSAAIWSVAYFLWQISESAVSALFWSRVLMAGAIFIPATYLQFIFALLEILKKRKKFLIFSYFLFSIFFLFNFTPYFVSHVEPLSGFKFWPIAGPAYHLFLIFWVFYAYYSVFILLKFYKKSQGILNLQLKWITIGTIIGYTGGITNYFLWYKIPILPVGNITASIYLLFVAYTILKYRLMDIRIVVKKIAVYFAAAGFAYGMFYLLVWLFDNFFGGVFRTSSYISGLFIAPVFVLVFIWFYGFIQRIANRYFFYSLYNYQQMINNLSQRLNYINDLDEIVGLIVDTVKQSMQLDRAGVLLVEQKEGAIYYKVVKVVGFDEKNGISLVQDNFLTRYLQKKQKPLVREELLMLAKDFKYSQEEKKGFLELENNMKHIEASLCLPLTSSKKLIGIIVLGSKVSGDAYTKEDLELLNTFSYQAGIAIDNALLYKKIQDFSRTLQQKVDEQTKDIQRAYEVEKKAKEDLEKLNEIKNEFMLVTQHHLRTPLTSMMGYMDLIEKGVYGKVPEKLKEVIKRFGSSSQNLIKIVNEFLDISQFQLGKKVIAPKPGVNLEIILDGIIKELAFQAKEKGVYLKLEKIKEAIPLIEADPQKLQVALFNVIDNSIKYTIKGGTTVLLQLKDSKINIIVKDTGIGMEKKDIDNLFKNFLIRGEGAKKINVTGRGIGLYLSSKIIEAHNGVIRAESEGREKGSSFYIELPVKY